MANEISLTPKITLLNGVVNVIAGQNLVRADQNGTGYASESKRVTTSEAVSIIALMTTPGIGVISNDSAEDSGDDNLIVKGGVERFLLLKPGEQFPIRFDPAQAAYAVEASGGVGCDYSCTIFED